MRLQFHQDCQAVVVTLPETDYGSLADLNVGRAREQLLLLCEHTHTAYVVLDLATIRRLGAAFLGGLVKVATELRQQGRRLVVCGDRWDLTARTHLHRLLTVQLSRHDALQWCRSDLFRGASVRKPSSQLVTAVPSAGSGARVPIF